MNTDQRVFEQNIFSTSFYRAKTKKFSPPQKCSKKFRGGEVPSAMKEIHTLPGVARKTENVVLGNAYDLIEGIAVDTHVKRIASILAFTKSKLPDNHRATLQG